MRTTIELSHEHRAALLRLAAKRGLKGFSTIIEEAVEQYLEQQRSRQPLVDAALSVRGALEPKDADELAATTTAIRENWR